jgi:uncharacterized protein (TIGR02996 family)
VTDTLRGLLAAVLADPDDDAVRLVYADALEEAGQPERAEFIRVQVELEVGNFRCNCTCEYEHGLGCPAGRGNTLRRRQWELLDTAMEPQSAAFAWSQPLHSTGIALGRPWPDAFAFRRGFVEAVTLSAESWMAHGDAILAAHPVTQVTLTTVPELDMVGYPPTEFRLRGREEWRGNVRRGQPGYRHGQPGPARHGVAGAAIGDRPRRKRRLH